MSSGAPASLRVFMPTTPLLDPSTLSRLSSLQLRARGVVEGVLTGLHKSRHQGQAVEFAEHKEYAPGDEIRHIDWRAYARIDRHYVKKYEVETNLRAYLVVDASASMAYGRKGPDKLDYARVLGAALSYLLVRQQDQVGLVVAGKAASTKPAAAEFLSGAADDSEKHLPAGVRRYVPPRASGSHLSALLQSLESLQPHGETDLAAALQFIAEKAQRRAQVFVLSDLFDPSPNALAAIARLRRRRCEVAVFHLLDRDELEFPFDDPTEFLGLESDDRIEAHPRAIREGYLEEMRGFLERTRRQMRESDVEYTLVPTDEPADRVLLKFLAARMSAGGRR